jgi:hypothetical protein
MKTKYKIKGGGFGSDDGSFQYLEIEMLDSAGPSVRTTIWFPESAAEQMQEALLTALQIGKNDIARDRGEAHHRLSAMEIVVED